jgi:hypothetical protein
MVNDFDFALQHMGFMEKTFNPPVGRKRSQACEMWPPRGKIRIFLWKPSGLRLLHSLLPPP